MFHIDNDNVKNLLLKGHFGLERESLRISEDGFFAQTPHPFPDEPHIVRDFCENQTEINTPVTNSAAEAVRSLSELNHSLQTHLSSLTPAEMLWPFSNPPYIRSDEDIPIAVFCGQETGKSVYREYLANRYGKYKMTFSGIHFNFSFDEQLLTQDYKISGESDFNSYKDQVYLTLARRMVQYGWIIVVLTAASPVMDSSFVKHGRLGESICTEMSSVRCGENGYWNNFIPILDYTDITSYANSIQKYVNSGWLKAPSELYYPVRLKPHGSNTLARLREFGADHIELRMFDLNPLAPAGVEVRDIEFAHLMMVWLSSTPAQKFNETDQLNAIANFKNAARYDLRSALITDADGRQTSAEDAAKNIIDIMKTFYRDAPDDIQNVLDFEQNKLINNQKRYAAEIRKKFGDCFVQKGLELAKQRQKEAIENV